MKEVGQAAPRLWRGVILPGCGHWTQQERPDEVNQELLGLSASHERPVDSSDENGDCYR
jgi:pimeloyl-ACP methyl ester carboxylesterase